MIRMAFFLECVWGTELLFCSTGSPLGFHVLGLKDRTLFCFLSVLDPGPLTLSRSNGDIS